MTTSQTTTNLPELPSELVTRLLPLFEAPYNLSAKDLYDRVSKVYTRAMEFQYAGEAQRHENAVENACAEISAIFAEVLAKFPVEADARRRYHAACDAVVAHSAKLGHSRAGRELWASFQSALTSGDKEAVITLAGNLPTAPTAKLVLDCTRAQKGSYVRAANGRKLADWCLEQLDAAAKEPAQIEVYTVVLITKHHSGFDMWQSGDLQVSPQSSYGYLDDLIAAVANASDRVASIEDALKDPEFLELGIEDIRGRIYNQPQWLYARIDHGELSYFGVVESKVDACFYSAD